MDVGGMSSGSVAAGLSGLGGGRSVEVAGQEKRRTDQEMFSEILAQAKVDGDESPEQRARKAAEQLVSTALVQPIFKKLRESNMAAAPFGVTRAERTFGPMRDAALAQRMVGSQGWGLVDQLARRMLENRPGDAVKPG